MLWCPFKGDVGILWGYIGFRDLFFPYFLGYGIPYLCKKDPFFFLG